MEHASAITKNILSGISGDYSIITEIFLLFHSISILPALPEELHDGFVTGLCAKGGFIIDIEWKSKKLQSLSIFSKFGIPIKIRYHERLIEFGTQSGKKYNLDAELKLK